MRIKIKITKFVSFGNREEIFSETKKDKKSSLIIIAPPTIQNNNSLEKKDIKK